MHTHELLAIASAIVPERTATIFNSHRSTYADLAQRSNRLANALAALGMGPGDRLAVLDVNTPYHLELYFAAARLDAIYVPLNFRGREDELLPPLEISRPVTLLAGARYMPIVERMLPAVPSLSNLIVMDGEERKGWRAYEPLLASGGDEEIRFPQGDDSAPAALLFTAGTTGRPKGVTLTQASFTSFMLSNVEAADPDVEERTLLTVPIYHVAGLQAALASVYGGRTLVVQRQFEPREWMELVDRESVQRALLVPTMLRQVLDHPDFNHHDLSSLRVITYGGAPMPPSLIVRAVEALPHCQFINAFGQTETGSTIAMVPPEDHVLQGPPHLVAERRRHLSSIGKPLPDVEVRIVDEAGEPLPSGEVGEIVAKGPRLMTGYWDQKAETSQVLRDGWLYTGDLGHQDDDGYLYLSGRAKDFIKRGGEMVSPEEVENLLHDHLGVQEAAVIGVPDETWGERVLAVVVPRPGTPVTEEELLERCHEHLARFKRPESVVFVDELPRNSLGKVLKRELRERYSV
jgi:acyl-CoA synthetase (AMP-forming)/AMP-acid ligase II